LLLNIPPHQKRVATLHCEKYQSSKLSCSVCAEP